MQLDLDGEVLAEQLFRAYLKQILVDGFVHADPHPGNVFLTEDNRIALLDLGMVARVTPSIQEKHRAVGSASGREAETFPRQGALDESFGKGIRQAEHQAIA